MSLVRVQTIHLAGPALRWALAQALAIRIRYSLSLRYGSEQYAVGDHYGTIWEKAFPAGVGNAYGWNPDKDWGIAGQLIQQFRVEIEQTDITYACCRFHGRPGRQFGGGTLLVDIARSVVDRLSGDEVLVPAELAKGGA